MRRFRISPLIGLLLILYCIPLASLYSAPADVLLDTMQHELHRASAALAKADPAALLPQLLVADANSVPS